MNKADLEGLMAKVAELGRVSEEEARRIVNEVYDDGVVSRAEADTLFDLNDRLSGADPLWDARFGEAIKDYLLTVEAPIGWVSEEECAWLIERIKRDGDTRIATEVDLLLEVLRYADGAPAKLGLFALEACCTLAAEQGQVLTDDVERIRRALYAPAGDGAVWVTKAEATVLFKLNDQVAHARNDKAWNELFARAIANHLMACAHPDAQSEADAFAREKWLESKSHGVGGFFGAAVSSLTDGSWFSKVTYDVDKAAQARRAAKAAAERAASEIDADETDWLVKRLGWDKTVSPAERALIDFLKEEAPGFTSGIAAAA